MRENDFYQSIMPICANTGVAFGFASAPLNMTFSFFSHRKKKERDASASSFPVGYEKVNMTDGCDLFATFEQRLSVDDCLSIVS